MIKTPLSTVIGGAFWTPKATIVGSTSKTLNQLIKSLFANNEQGFAYNPNDLSTMYQDAAGTIPVTAAGQLVGLMLDKSKSLTLGVELNTNKFTTNLTGWAAPLAGSSVIEEGEAKITFTGSLENTSGNWLRLLGTYKVGERFLVTFDATHVSGTGSLQVGTSYVASLAITPTSNGKVKRTYSAYCSSDKDSAAGIIAFASTVSGDVWKISNVSVKELAGNHAYQNVSASRPILQRNATTGAYYLAFDGVDDWLTTKSFPIGGAATTIFVGSLGSRTGTAAIASKGVAGYIYQTQTQVTVQSVNNSLTVPINGNTVITAKYAASGTGVSLKVNNIISSNQLTTDRGYNNSNPLIIGAFNIAGAVPFFGNIYALIGVGKDVSASECKAIEKELAKRTGVTLNV